MPFIVRVSGPDFPEEESRKAFLRIEESVRQFSAHSRESIFLTRNPLNLPNDHFTLFWSHGAALVELLPRGGKIHGGPTGDWSTEETDAHSVSESSFANPYQEMTRAMESLRALLRAGIAVKKSRTLLTVESGERAGREGLESQDDIGLAAMKVIVLFTLPIGEVRIDESLRDQNFSAMSLEYATSRTVYHLPNLLRQTDQETVVYTPEELEVCCATLEREALKREKALRADHDNPPVIRLKKAAKSGAAKFRWWWLPGILIPLVILYMILRPASRLSSTKTVDSTTVPHRHTSVTEIVVILPQEVQLYLSPNVYRTRAELDVALSHGEGERILPTSPVLIISLDSLEFAKGVYGYFKADNTWRKGKLLQSFHSNDTIKIDNFLPPLN